MTRHGFVLAVLFLLTTLGCGGDGLTPTHGTVTLDGRPLERGRIEFEPADGRGPLAAAQISDGKYTTSAMTGKKIVRITGGKVVGRRPFSESSASHMIEDVKALVPPAYNSASTLTCEVERGQEVYDFELKSSP